MNKSNYWVILDIETTGLEPSQDAIIDLGFVLLDGVEIVQEYSSRVNCAVSLWSPFIEQLTGIRYAEIENAPSLEDVLNEIRPIIANHPIIAHNVAFEKKFLEGHFDHPLNWIDSIPLIYFLKPTLSTLNLDFLIKEFQLGDGEKHQGLSDSLDLFKVLHFLLTQLSIVERDQLIQLLDDCQLTEHFYTTLLKLDIKYQKKDEIGLQLPSKRSSTTIWDKFDGAHVQKVYNYLFEHAQEFGFNPDRLSEQLKLLSYRIGQCFTHEKMALIQSSSAELGQLGFLIPSFLWASVSKEKVLITTNNTRNLQNIDLEMAQNLFPHLKIGNITPGKSHLCQLSFNEFPHAHVQEAITNLLTKRIFQWNNSHQHIHDFILLSGIPYVLQKNTAGFKQILDNNKVQKEKCIGAECPHAQGCSYFQSIQVNSNADIFIGLNEVLFDWPRDITFPKYIINDAAYSLEAATTSFFEQSLELQKINSDLCQILYDWAKEEKGFNPLYSFEIPLKRCLDQLIPGASILKILHELANSNEFISKFVSNPKEVSCSFFIHEDSGVSLKMTPINPGRNLYDSVLMNAKSVISITDAIGDELGMSWSLGQYYLEQKRKFPQTVIIPRIVDVEHQLNLEIIAQMPSMYSNEYVPTIIKKVLKQIKQIGGKSLLLFSSKNRFNQALNELLFQISGETKVFYQGMSTDALEVFKKTPQSIFVGMDQSTILLDDYVDFLVMDKIPDLPMGHYIEKKRDFFANNIGPEFVHYYLHTRTRLLLQKLTMMKLTMNGNPTQCVVFDSRIKTWKTSTWNEFKKMMLPYKVQGDIA